MFLFQAKKRDVDAHFQEVISANQEIFKIVRSKYFNPYNLRVRMNGVQTLKWEDVWRWWKMSSDERRCYQQLTWYYGSYTSLKQIGNCKKSSAIFWKNVLFLKFWKAFGWMGIGGVARVGLSARQNISCRMQFSNFWENTFSGSNSSKLWAKSIWDFDYG